MLISEGHGEVQKNGESVVTKKWRRRLGRLLPEGGHDQWFIPQQCGEIRGKMGEEKERGEYMRGIETYGRDRKSERESPTGEKGE